MMPSLIHEDQSGFMQNRFENILELLGTIEYCEKEQIPAIIVSFDFEKAFDHVEWSIVNKIVNKLNFGQKFRTVLKLFYRNVESTVINNGFTAEWFNLSRSLHQGDPLSSLFYSGGRGIGGTD